jgi:hypothetical protein
VIVRELGMVESLGRFAATILSDDPSRRPSFAQLYPYVREIEPANLVDAHSAWIDEWRQYPDPVVVPHHSIFAALSSGTSLEASIIGSIAFPTALR